MRLYFESRQSQGFSWGLSWPALLSRTDLIDTKLEARFKGKKYLCTRVLLDRNGYKPSFGLPIFLLKNISSGIYSCWTQVFCCLKFHVCSTLTIACLMTVLWVPFPLPSWVVLRLFIRDSSPIPHFFCATLSYLFFIILLSWAGAMTSFSVGYRTMYQRSVDGARGFSSPIAPAHWSTHDHTCNSIVFVISNFGKRIITHQGLEFLLYAR